MGQNIIIDLKRLSHDILFRPWERLLARKSYHDSVFVNIAQWLAFSGEDSRVLVCVGTGSVLPSGPKACASGTVLQRLYDLEKNFALGLLDLSFPLH